MKIRSLILLCACGAVLPSCVYYTPNVPDMPYQGAKIQSRTYADTWVVTPAAATNPAPQAAPAAAAPAAKVTPPAPAPAPLDLTKPIISPQPATPAAPAAAPASAAPAAPAVTAPAPAAPALSTAVDKSQITNTGPIPVATRVEGDPTRVYNPLDPSKTIRVIDKNGKPYPSGKELKVRGTNFHFYVP